VTRCAS